MSISRVRNWNPGDVLTAFDLNAEFNNIIANPVALWSPAQQNVNFNGRIVTWDSGGVSTSNSTAASGLLFSPGMKSGAPGTVTGSQLDIATQTFSDTNTAASGTATKFASTVIHAPTLSAANLTVTTTDAATLYVDGPVVTGTNETITNPWAVWANGPARFGGAVQFDAGTQGAYSPWSTGDIKPTFKITADAGWVLMNDGTLGDASSGGTARANADTSALFSLLWTNIPALTISGGRGGSAASDYAAHKTITLPLALGRAFFGAGAGAGLTSRTLGASLGGEDAIVPLHNHNTTEAPHSHPNSSALPVGVGSGDNTPGNGVSTLQSNGASTSTAVTGLTINNTGVSTTGQRMPPATFINVMIKL